jgi:hypothetical protein
MATTDGNHTWASEEERLAHELALNPVREEELQAWLNDGIDTEDDPAFD